MRCGFTLVETLVALVLVQFGLLALAATAAIAVRDVALAQREARARDAVRERIEMLRAGACAANTAGSHAGGTFTETWRVTGDGAVKTISDSVEFALPGGRRGRLAVSEKMLCG